MAKVTGIGGIFFKAREPEAIQAWYRDVMGITMEPDHPSAAFHWRRADDPEDETMTVWGIFSGETSYFGTGPQQYMINYQVDDLDGMLARLREAGAEVVGTEEHEYGRFGWVIDPEGVRIELWQPPEAAGS